MIRTIREKNHQEIEKDRKECDDNVGEFDALRYNSSSDEENDEDCESFGIYSEDLIQDARPIDQTKYSIENDLVKGSMSFQINLFFLTAEVTEIFFLSYF